MEVANERLTEDQLGPKIAAGRDTTIYALGDDKVVRRAADDRSFTYEAEAMEHLRAAGFPVPEVHRVAPGEMVLDRIEGPTMLDDLGSHPWRMRAYARLLADLHARLARLPAPDWLREFPAPGNAVLHLDFHPGNVIMAPGGPVVIDWTNVRRGEAAGDVAATWIILAVFEADETGVMKVVVALFRKVFVRFFLQAADRAAAAKVLPAVAEYRKSDRNIRPTERARLDALVARESGGTS